MNTKTTGIVAALALALGLFWFFYDHQGGARREKATAEAKKVFQNLDTTQIIELTEQPEDGVQVRMAKMGSTWMLEKPVQAKADTDQVSGVLTQLAQVENKEAVTDKPSPEQLKGYGLVSPTAWATFKTLSAPAQTIWFGAKDITGRDNYARVTENPSVFLVAGYNLASIAKKASDLRDKAVWTFDPAAISGIKARLKEATFELAKDKDGVWRLGPDRADADKVNELLQSLRYLRVKDFVDEEGTQPGKWGLGSETVEIQQAGKSEPLVLTRGKATADGKGFNARLKGNKPVFTLEKVSFDVFGRLKGSLIDTSAFAVKPYECVKLMVEAKGNSFTAEKKEGQWIREGVPKANTATAQAISDFVDKVGMAKFDSRKDGGALKPYVARVVFYGDGGKILDEARFGGKGKKAATCLASSLTKKQDMEVASALFEAVPK